MPPRGALTLIPQLEQEEVDLELWRRIVLPTMNVHLLGLDKRSKDEQFVNSPKAMHYCNICIPYAPMLFDGFHDTEALIADLLKRVKEKYSTSKRGKQVMQFGSLRTGTTHHKKKEYEMGGLRFVVSACSSDRLAAVLEFTPKESTDGQDLKKIEMLHWYVAMGLPKQHHAQKVMLCRVRDFALAQVVVDVIQKHLRIDNCSVRSNSKDKTQCEEMLDER